MSHLIAIYGRVSTDEQASVVEGSLTNQQHRIKSFIDIKNMQESDWGTVVDFYIDDGYSAKDTNRPAYQRMMKDLKRGRINMVMVTELSRLSRSIPDFCDFLKAIDSQNGKFFSIKEQFDTSTSAGKMMLYNMINLAQFEREQISERVSINSHARAIRGLLSGSPSVLGYDKDIKNRTTYIVNEDEANQVRKIFELFVEYGSIGKTVQALEALGIKQKARENKRNRLVQVGRWTVDSLSYLLQNKAYIGLKEVNKVHKNKNQNHLKSWEKYSVVKASWSAIIDEKIFNEVQNVIKDNKEKERVRLNTAENRVFLLSSLCRCNECGRRLVGQSAHGANKVHRYYIHTHKKGDVINCTWKRIKAEEIELRITQHLAEILLKAGYFEQIEENIKKQNVLKPSELKGKKSFLQKELSKIALAMQNTLKVQSELELESEAVKDIAKSIQELSQKRRAVELELEKVKNAESLDADVDDAIVDLKSRLEAFNRGWSKAGAVARKSLLKKLIHSIEVRPNGLAIEFYLKHGLNTAAAEIGCSWTESKDNNVIQLKDKRITAAESSRLDSTGIHSSFGNLQDVVIGVPKGI